MLIELFKIVLTASLTLLGGVALFCLTNILTKLFFDPVLALRKTLGGVSFCLQYHGWFLLATDLVEKERFQKVFDELRTITARMRAEADSIFCYQVFVRLRVLPPHRDLIEAAGYLIRISNCMGGPKSDLVFEDMHKVQELLKIDIGRPKYKQNVEDKQGGGTIPKQP